MLAVIFSTPRQQGDPEVDEYVSYYSMSHIRRQYIDTERPEIPKSFISFQNELAEHFSGRICIDMSALEEK
jgi:hypothetical protein